MPAAQGFSFKARLRSFGYAGRGLRRLLQDEHNAWLHLAATIVAAITGAVLRISAADWRWLALAVALVWPAEAFNTAIEELCDHVQPDFVVAIGQVKDLAAGAVLTASIAAAVIGLLTLGPPPLAII